MEFFKTLVGSFYSPATYAAARAPQTGMKLLYSLLLVMLTCAAVMIAGVNFIHRILMTGDDPLLDRFVMNIANQVPVMTLKDGTLTVKAQQPYNMYLDVGDTKYPFLVIDTTGHTDFRTMGKSSPPILVTAREIYVKSSNDTKVYPLDSYNKDAKGPLIINRAMATDAATRGLAWLHENMWKVYLLIGIPAWLVFVLVAYILRIFMVMVLGLVGMVASHVLKPTIDFATSVQIASVAYTPVALLSTALLCFNGHSPTMLTLFALGTLMTCVGIAVSREA